MTLFRGFDTCTPIWVNILQVLNIFKGQKSMICYIYIVLNFFLNIRLIDFSIFQNLFRPCIGILHALYTYLLYEFLNIRRISDNEKTPFLSQSWKRAYLKGFCSWNIFSSILISTLQNPKIFFFNVVFITF